MANPNSLKNLKPWGKGQTGNPGGRVGLPAELKVMRKENLNSLIKLVHAYSGMTQEQAAQRLSGPDCRQLEQMVQGQISRATEGDTNAFRFIIEVMCGSLPAAEEAPSSLDNLSDQDKLKAMKAALKLFEIQVKEQEKLSGPTAD